MGPAEGACRVQMRHFFKSPRGARHRMPASVRIRTIRRFRARRDGGHIVRTIQVARPRAELAEFVEAYAQREMDCADGVFSQPNTSTLEQCLAFYLDGETTLDFADGRSRLAPSVSVFGSLIYPCGGARFAGHVLGFAAFLKPLALWQLFRVPASIIANQVFDGEDLLGRGVLDLWSKLSESESFEQRIRVV